MTFVDAHQAEFADHGICARSHDDPEFDRECFSAEGKSFEPDPVAAATAPLVCPLRPSEFRPYAPRARWIRTANDSYFTGDDLSARAVVDDAAEQHPRRDLGRDVGGLWRRLPSERRGPRGDGRRGAAGGARGARPQGAARGDRAAAAAAERTRSRRRSSTRGC